ncbi:MAG: gliding motility-associated C-terminal domain-containing protein [Flavobacteriales bacterium]|nr:gliding motility-associated C-terminal domain-containing protein [Flavobacteriales bacterium]
MKNRYSGFFYFLLILLVFPEKILKASHISGGDISYTCVGPNQYQVTLNLYRDCSGITMSTTEFITLTSTCGASLTFTLDLVNGPAGLEISQLCPPQMPQSSCNGGSLPGMQHYIYQGIVTLTPPCDTWTISWSTCCRNNTTNLAGGSGDDIYIQTTLNTASFPCNNSPVFMNHPTPYVCNGQQVNYNPAVVEPDGDSIAFTFISAMNASAMPLPYSGGYSAGQPIPGINLNPVTGQLTFTPTVNGYFVVVIQVTEYDANGNVIGTVMRDFQFVVQTCNNTVPAAPSAFTNINGQGIQTGPLEVTLCEGQSFCATLTFTDPNAGDAITLTSNAVQALPGSTQSLNGTNPASIQICWTAQPGSPSVNTVTVFAEDNACPIAGITSQNFVVKVITSTYAGPDQTICGSQVAQLQASGGSVFNWSVINGPPMQVGTNFSCNPCANPVASPQQTTTYVVVSDLGAGCTNTDTVKVFVVPDFSYSVTQSSPNSCMLQDVFLNVTVNPNVPGYQFQWSPSNGLSNPSIPNPVASFNTPGNKLIQLTVTSPQGCVKKDTITISVAPSYAPNVTATADTNYYVCGSPNGVQLGVNFAAAVPTICALSNTGNCPSTNTLTLGTGNIQNTSTTYPAPFGNWYWSSRHQMLYLASELQALGFNGGKIQSIAFEVLGLNGGTSVYNNFEVKIGCTNLTSLTSFQTGLVTVYSAPSLNITTGWNTLNFNTPYEWDGMSNIIIETCHFNPNYTYNPTMPATNTPFTSVVYAYQDVTSLCGTSGSSAWVTTGTARPNTRLGVCPTAAIPSNYTYQWTPAQWLNNPNIINPVAMPAGNITYTVTVTDIQGGCWDTASVTIFTSCGDCLPPIPQLSHITCHGGTNGKIRAIPVGAGGPPWTVTYFNGANNQVLAVHNGVHGLDSLVGLPAGTYIIRLTDTTGCSKDTTITLTQPTPVVVTAFNDTTICQSGTALVGATALGGNGAPYTFTWNQGLLGNGPHNVSPTASITYTVTASDAQGCTSGPDAMTVTVRPPLQAGITGQLNVCPLGGTTLSATAQGGSGVGYTYQWLQNGQPLGPGSQAYVVPPGPVASYCLVLSDNCGTPSDTACVQVTWYPVPPVSFSPMPQEACIPAAIQFVNTTGGGPGGQCTWYFGDGDTAVTCGTVTHVYNQPGCYDVRLKILSAEGCLRDTLLPNIVCARPLPTAAFSFGPQPTDIFNSTIYFTNESQGASHYQWYFGAFGELGQSTVENPAFYFPSQEAGAYDVMLVAFTPFGCSDTAFSRVYIDGAMTFYLPTAFTPDNDNLNEVFKPVGTFISTEGYHFLIFDRWGEKIFETRDLNAGWDGTFGGRRVKNDTYVWMVRLIELTTGAERVFKGHVSVLR